MVAHGADFNTFKDENQQGNSILHIAVKADNLDLLKFFKTNNVDLDLQNNNGETPLHLVSGK